MKTRSLIVGVIVAALGTGAAFIWSGLYDVSAIKQHLPPTYWLLEKTLQRSVMRSAARIAVPELGAPAQVSRGLALYRANCEQCHGAPGVAPQAFALGLTPLPTPLVQTGRERPPSYVFWVTKFGIRMSGMPAWEFRMTDDEIWSVVALVQRLPQFSPEEYRATAAPPVSSVKDAMPASGPNADRGKTALQQYACVACHQIPGITGPEARVGPPLAGIASRVMLGGVLPNSPDNIVRWIRAPQEVSPPTAMPNLGVTERDARDIAAYLATLK